MHFPACELCLNSFFKATVFGVNAFLRGHGDNQYPFWGAALLSN